MGTANIFGHDSKGNPVAIRANAQGEIMTDSGTAGMQTSVDEASGTVTYVGEAPIGTADGTNLWQIKKILVTGAVTTVRYADGVDTYTKNWTARATYTY